MIQLANAIALEVAFRQSRWYASSTFNTVTEEARGLRTKFILGEFEELRANSGLPVGTRDITTSHLAEAVALKASMVFRIQRYPLVLSDDYVLVRKGTPVRATHLRTYMFRRLGNARAAANKLNKLAERDSAKVEAVDEATRMKRLRLRLVRSARDGALVMERNDTPYTMSVASEAYWAA